MAHGYTEGKKEGSFNFFTKGLRKIESQKNGRIRNENDRPKTVAEQIADFERKKKREAKENSRKEREKRIRMEEEVRFTPRPEGADRYYGMVD